MNQYEVKCKQKMIFWYFDMSPSFKKKIVQKFL